MGRGSIGGGAWGLRGASIRSFDQHYQEFSVWRSIVSINADGPLV